MEEEGKYEPYRNIHSHGLLAHIGKHTDNYAVRQATRLSKMHQCFAATMKKNSQYMAKVEFCNEAKGVHRLVKHQNKIEANILRHKNTQSRHRVHKAAIIKLKGTSGRNTPNYQQYFTPKTRKQIISRHNSITEKQNVHGRKHNKLSMVSLHMEESDRAFERSALNLSRSAVRKRGNGKRSKEELRKMDSNILKSSLNLFMELENRKGRLVNKQISEYHQKELQSYYQSLIKYSRGDAEKYKNGFQIMLNLMNVSTNDKILAEWFNHFKANPTFSEFKLAYTNIVDAVVRESVMDFFDIVFQDCGIKEWNREELTYLLSVRMPLREAQEIVEEIFEIVNPEPNKPISSSVILALCCTNDQFCWFMRQFKILEHQKK